VGATGAERHPVFDVLHARARSGSRPGARDDQFRVGLVIEGGAMRGVVSAGMATGLEALGLRDAFDVVYGSSAGACAGAYFLAGQARAGARIYFEVVNNRAFIDWWRSLRGRPIVNLDLLFDRTLREDLPLDFPALQASGVDLVVLASHVDEAHDGGQQIVEPTRLSNFEDVDDLLGALHAGARIPVYGGAPVEYRGMRFWDAAITQPIPVHTAMADGCTHILVLLTLPRGARRRRYGLIDNLLVAPRIAATSPALGVAHRTGFERYAVVCREIYARHEAADGPPYVAGINLSSTTPSVRRLELRGDRLAAGARAGGDAVLAAFGRPDAHLDADLTAVDERGQPLDVRLISSSCRAGEGG
jgi:predicted patatin/cPLA2 family phospholipase